MNAMSVSRHWILPIVLAMSVFHLPGRAAWGCSSDPDWSETLRCKLFSNAPPQPPSPPTDVADIKDFTRVDLDTSWPNDRLRCIDGTVPHIYVDQAESGTSDNWLITMQGGGSCNGGQACLNAYLDPREHGEMTSAHDPAMVNLEGIHRPGPNDFADYHRIRVKKCGFDRHNGDATLLGVEATVDSDVDGDGVQGEFLDSLPPPRPRLREGEDLTFTLYHHGRRILDELLVVLRDGLTYQTWEDDGSGMVASVEVTLPPLRDAEKVLFVGHSGGAHGLMNAIDDLAATMSGWTRSDEVTDFGGDVRALFDAQLIPSVESEAAFNEYLDGDLYDHMTLCRAPCESGAPLHYTYDGMAYFSSGGAGVGADVDGYFDGPYTEWNVGLDASCLAAHPTDAWRCADRFHVLFNHITTPFFLREDVRDPNAQHNNNNDPRGPQYDGHRLFWATPSLAYCNDPAATVPCSPTLSPTDYRARVEEQAERLIEDFATRSELAVAGGVVPTIYLWLPSCREHNGAFQDAPFFNTRLESVSLGTSPSMHDFLVEFMNDVPDGAVSARIDGEGDMVSSCP